MSGVTNIDFGTLYQEAWVEGIIHIPKCDPITVPLTAHCRQVFSMINSGSHAGQKSDCWLWFRVNTENVGRYLTGDDLPTSNGPYLLQVDLEVRERPASGGRVLFVGTPYSDTSAVETLRNLSLMLSELEIDMSAYSAFPPEDLSLFHTVVLWEGALASVTDKQVALLHTYMQSGGKLVLLADYFHRGTVSGANKLMQRYGVTMRDEEMEETQFESTSAFRSTSGVARVLMKRASVINAGTPDNVLVSAGGKPDEAVVSRCGPNGNLYTIGVSTLSRLLSVGWPFDNGRLFAALLRQQA